VESLDARIMTRERLQPSFPAIVSANWSSWTSLFDPLRINNLQHPSRNLLIASEGVGHAGSVLSRQNRQQIPKNQAITAKRRVWRVCEILVSY